MDLRQGADVRVGTGVPRHLPAGTEPAVPFGRDRGYGFSRAKPPPWDAGYQGSEPQDGV